MYCDGYGHFIHIYKYTLFFFFLLILLNNNSKIVRISFIFVRIEFWFRVSNKTLFYITIIIIIGVYENFINLLLLELLF